MVRTFSLGCEWDSELQRHVSAHGFTLSAVDEFLSEDNEGDVGLSGLGRRGHVSSRCEDTWEEEEEADTRGRAWTRCSSISSVPLAQTSSDTRSCGSAQTGHVSRCADLTSDNKSHLFSSPASSSSMRKQTHEWKRIRGENTDVKLLLSFCLLAGGDLYFIFIRKPDPTLTTSQTEKKRDRRLFHSEP